MPPKTCLSHLAAVVDPARFRRPRPAFGRRGANEASRYCTTQRPNTHNTSYGRVLYEFHPWCGRDVCIERVLSRAGISVARCRLGDKARRIPPELPLSMLDRQACASIRPTEEPVADLFALRALRFLLAEFTGIDSADRPLSSTDSDLSADFISCDQNRGKDHAPNSNEARPAGPVRSVAKNPSLADTTVAQPAGSNAPQDHAPDDPVANGAWIKRVRGVGRRGPSVPSDKSVPSDQGER